MPEPYVVATNGELIEVIDNNGMLTYQSVLNDLTASYLVTVHTGDLILDETREAGQVPIRNYFAGQHFDTARPIFEDTSEMVTFYEDIIGDTIDGFTYVSESAKIALCDFFGVDGNFCAATKKKNKSDIWVYLPNREGVENKFKGTKYEWMVRDEHR